MSNHPSATKIVVISDSDKLGRVLALNLSSYGDVVRLSPETPSAEKRCADDEIGLIVIASSTADSEPLVALARASLGAHLGRTPILIISEREFNAEPAERIGYLNFPFSNEALRHAVTALLEPNRRPSNYGSTG